LGIISTAWGWGPLIHQARIRSDFFFFETESYYVAQAVLDLEVLLPQPGECCDQVYITVSGLDQWFLMVRGRTGDFLKSPEEG
jgi:hypothetical protein